MTEVNTNVAAAPLEGGIWGFGLGVNVPIGVRDVTPPAITIDTEGTKYISPNFDGVKDDLVLPLAITDERYVKGYRFIITDSSGAAVRTILNKEDRPENRDFKNILARLALPEDGDHDSADDPLGRDVGLGHGRARRHLPLPRGGMGRQQQPRQEPGGHRRRETRPPDRHREAPT